MTATLDGGETIGEGFDATPSGAKRLERELREARARLEEFTYVTSHDLKAPLRGIGELAGWLSEDLQEASPEARRNLERIQIRVKRMERMLDDLLAYACARDLASTVVTIRPEELLSNLLELQAPPDSFAIQLELTAQPFRASRTPLETVLRNLLSNALRHHDGSQGRVRISMVDEGAHCHIEVSDDGPGIPRAVQERVFKSFQNLSHAERTGSGLGLALCKRLVESHGGRIELASQEGRRGTTVHVWWPRAEQKRVDTSREAAW